MPLRVCFIDGEFTVKRLKVEEECIFLIPENPNYKPIKVTEDNQLIIWGVVTYVVKKYKLNRVQNKTIFFLIFLLAAGLNLMGQVLQIDLLAHGSKTLIIPALMGYVWNSYSPTKLYLMALFFSWLGDLFLIPSGTAFSLRELLPFG